MAQKVPIGKQAKDKDKDLITKLGHDTDYVELATDYGSKSQGKHPCTRTYFDRLSGKSIALISLRPQVDHLGEPIVIGWDDLGSGHYSAKNNTFTADVSGDVITLIDRVTGDILTFHPQLYLDNQLVPAISQNATKLTDGILVWDYGIAKRYYRLVKGAVFGSWEFGVNPGGTIKFVYNQSGSPKLRLGRYAIDANIEEIPAAKFPSTYPFTVSDSATFYAQGGGGVDAFIQQYGDDSDWAAIHDATSGIATETISMDVGARDVDFFGYKYYIFRGFLHWDTSALGAGATISAGTVSLYVNFKSADASHFNLYASTAASNTSVVDEDYDQIGTTPYATALATAGITTGAWNTWTLIAAGLAAINKTGFTKFSIREDDHDVANSAPARDTSYVIQARSYEFLAADDPQLAVTYTSVVAPTITLSAASLVEATTARLNGNVTDAGGENPTVTVYWGTSNGGQVPANWANSSAPTSPAQPQGVAAFYADVTGLPSGTTIYFSAKATNSGGTSWPAASGSFLTKPAAPTGVAATRNLPNKVTATWTKPTGATNYRVYRDAGDISGLLGDVATYDDTAAPQNASVHSYYIVASNATGNSANSSSVSGQTFIGGKVSQNAAKTMNLGGR